MANAHTKRGRYLTIVEVRAIKADLARGVRPTTIASRYGVCLKTVYLILTRELHREVA